MVPIMKLISTLSIVIFTSAWVIPAFGPKATVLQHCGIIVAVISIKLAYSNCSLAVVLP